MLTIHFSKSKSKKYNEAVKTAKKFSGYKQDTMNHVTIPVKEVFEKWQTFNSLIWTVIDWKGTTIEFDGRNYHSHTDKTRIFYSLQNAHLIRMNQVRLKIEHSCVYREEINFDTIDTKGMTEEEINRLIDLYTVFKKSTEKKS